MSGTMIEVAALRLEPLTDARLAIGRLAAIGPVVLLRGLRADGYSATVSTDAEETLGGPWNDLVASGPEASRSEDNGRPDPRAVARLEAARSADGADWLIATEAILPSARACRGLRVICLGPGDDQLGPTRPDHRAHSLLDATRIIETAAAFA